jgi:hypothetical protein
MNGKLIAAAAVLGMVTACESEAPKPAAPEKAKSLLPGEFEISSTVTKVESTDKTTPATAAKVGEKSTYRGCVAADGTLEPAIFIDKGDKCTVQNSYVRGGRLSIQYQCTRPGRGPVYPNVDGLFTADGFEAQVNSGTSFSGDGDYRMSRSLTAKRVGDCPAADAAKG